MKRIIIFWAILQVVTLESKHQIVTIYNKTTDLIFNYAYKMVNGKQKEMPALTTRLQEASNKKKQHVVIEHTVGPEGLGIKMYDVQGNKYNLFIDGQLTADIEFNRKKSQKLKKFPQSCKFSDGSHCARALLEHENSTMIASIAYPHKQEGDLVNLVVSGSNGHYTLSYEHAA